MVRRFLVMEQRWLFDVKEQQVPPTKLKIENERCLMNWPDKSTQSVKRPAMTTASTGFHWSPPLTGAIHGIHTPLTPRWLLTRSKKNATQRTGLDAFNLSLYYIVARVVHNALVISSGEQNAHSILFMWPEAASTVKNRAKFAMTANHCCKGAERYTLHRVAQRFYLAFTVEMRLAVTEGIFW